MPPETAPTVWRLAGTGAAIGAYAFVSHLLMVHAPDRAWSVAALFGPLWGALALGAWAKRHWPTLAFCAAALATIALVVARGGVEDIHLMYVLQHAGVHLTLAWAFGMTLRPGREALITSMAAHVHGAITAPLREYTRGLTRAWVVYFLAMVAVSFTLYAVAPWSTWSLFCNVITPLAAIGFFFAELVWRRLSHPEFESVSLARVWHAWQQRRPGGANG